MSSMTITHSFDVPAEKGIPIEESSMEFGLDVDLHDDDLPFRLRTPEDVYLTDEGVRILMKKLREARKTFRTKQICFER